MLRVAFRLDDDEASIVIEENGNGLTNNEIEALNRRLERTSESAESPEVTGLINIHRRIALTYGESSGLVLSRSPLNGLRVQIRIRLTEGMDMYRLLVVDDEEIITNSLYEVFHQWMTEKLDVCRAYSGKEALNWMSRTRIDIVLTDIRMPGMSGLELTESIRALWPRSRIIFLTGYSDFDYAYQAIQMSNVRYLLKTEGFDKVMEVVKDVIDEIESGNRMNEWLKQSRIQIEALEWMEQGSTSGNS